MALARTPKDQVLCFVHSLFLPSSHTWYVVSTLNVLLKHLTG
jgi:hypothetical protein